MIPTLAEELERKTRESIFDLIDGVKKGFFDEKTASIVAHYMWKTTAGLFPPTSDMCEIMTALSETFSTHIYPAVRISLCNDAEILTFVWKFDQSSFYVVKREFGIEISKKDYRESTPEDAINKVKRMTEGLLQRGWKLL